MCGIAGLINFDADHLDQKIVENMTDVMRYRGPDDEGVFSDRHVVLGHVRLSIIDVAGSTQPLSNEDGSIWVVFNGEIYNYHALREELAAKGHRFTTDGDTETLVHLYEEYGGAMVSRLQGMFAFAIWDKREQSLFMARDRMGIKPLYYCTAGNDFIFASEPKALLQHPKMNVRADAEGIWHYLTYRSVPSPGTMFEGVTKVRPGYTVTLTRRGCLEECYWDIPLVPIHSKRPYRRGDAKSMTDQVESLLMKSVERRLISDVPLGAFLSGGVDSSLIVALMSRLTHAPVRTYSVGFPSFPFSEAPYAKTVAELYGTDHHELILEEDCFAEHFEPLTWIRDSPLSEPADVPLYLLAKMASSDVKVLLSGEGSDELFAGYPKYAYDHFAGVVNVLPEQAVRRAGYLLPSRFRRVEVALRSLCETEQADRWAQWFAPFTRGEKLRLLTADETWGNPTKEYVRKTPDCDPLDAMLYADCKIWLPDNLLDRGDRMTMGASVEGRVPFLDHELVELAFSLPSRFKVSGFQRKWVVKQIARRYLPARIVERRKVGFSVPLAQWFRNKLRDMCYDRICRKDGLMRQLFANAELQSILDDHCSDRKDNALKIWTLLTLSVWDDVFCRNRIVKTGLGEAACLTKQTLRNA
ncbi:MAG: asparagine synthase (glutamine-hydrolyzing) [Sedimentisphaerales bacterium]|jgi:asparagine synthase (glutamine-hydrolysing)